MKPIIICVEANDDGQITISEKVLKEYIDLAYESGFKDGAAKYSYSNIREPFIRKSGKDEISCDNLERTVTLF